ncbi:hypothetical protein [Enemella evansiae]|uniref:hypothetical protein n=1 Tax=Enemella evansiae TaxID=2016499 RepID=UPI000B962053|nr:hypothetical protein [Enemella evansiae]OYO03959.1 hypothetical protein CGZ97_11245 [Enemella evansiae]
MSTLLRPELERFLTRPITWIGALTASVLIVLIGWATGTPNRFYDQVPRPAMNMNDGVNTLMVVALFASALAYWTAASYAGSELSSGVLGTWLTFTPRRVPVYLAKVVTVALPSFGFALLFALVLLGLQHLRTPGSGSTLQELVGLAVRIAVTAASFAILGLVAAIIGRSTLSALGILLGYLVLMMTQAWLINSMNTDHDDWFGPERVLGQFLLTRAPVDGLPHMPGSAPRVDLYFDYSPIALAGFGWLLIMAAVVAVGGLVFARRDVN